MNKKHILISLSAVIGLWMILTPVSSFAGLSMNYQYNLANFHGIIASMWDKVAVDQENGEVFAFNSKDKVIRIFNDQGMLIYQFGEDVNLGSTADFCPGEDGNIYVLNGTYGNDRPPVAKYNYRGEPVTEIRLKDVPTDFAPFHPDRLDYRDNKLYLADTLGLKIVVTDIEGNFLQGYDVFSLIKEKAGDDEEFKEKMESRDYTADIGADINGFSVDKHGNIYFTIPIFFAAFRLSPEGTLEQFGIAGSAPGKFGIAAGIAADQDGNIFVTDRLRCVVLVFDKKFNFMSEYGYRGPRPRNLVVPDDLALDEINGKAYIAQAAYRGVSVFNINK